MIKRDYGILLLAVSLGIGITIAAQEIGAGTTEILISAIAFVPFAFGLIFSPKKK